MRRKLPILYYALDPQRLPVSVLVSPTGEIVTDMKPKPGGAVPIFQSGVRVDSQGRTRLQ